MDPFFDALTLFERAEAADSARFASVDPTQVAAAARSVLSPWPLENMHALVGPSRRWSPDLHGRVTDTGSAWPQWRHWIDQYLIQPLEAASLDHRCPPAAETAPEEFPFSSAFSSVFASVDNRLRVAGITEAPLRIALARPIRERIGRLSSKTIYSQWLEWARPARSGSRTQAGFVDALTRGRLISILQDYPMLARQLASAIHYSIGSAVSFAEIHKAAWTSICQLSGVDATAKIHDVTFGLSDEHLPGMTVARVRATDGRTFIFKPRSSATDTVFRELLRQVHFSNSAIEHISPKTLSVGEFSWTVDVSEPSTGGYVDRHRYFACLGRLLALFWLLGTTDIHFENLMCSGGLPSIVDTETLIHPTSVHILPNSSACEALVALQHELSSSVLATLLLPNSRQVLAGLAQFDASAVRESPLAATPARVLRWRRNADGQWTPTYAQERFAIASNGSVNASASDRACLYAAFRDSAAEFTQIDFVPRILEAARYVPFRVLIRPTVVYSRCLDALTHPRYLRSGAEWSLQLSRLCRVTAKYSRSDSFSRLVQAEHDAMLIGCVPRFTTMIDSHIVVDGFGRRIDGVLATSAEECLATRVRDADAALQCDLVRGTLGISADPNTRLLSMRDGPRAATSAIDTAVQVALRCCSVLVSDMRVASDGSAIWMGLSPSTAGRGVAFHTPDEGLYSGVSGIALALAAASLWGTPDCADAADAAWSTVKSLVEAKLARTDPRWHRGGLASGVECAAYTGTILTSITGNPRFASDSQQWIEELASLPALSERWDVCDLLAGHAGSLLCVLAIRESCLAPACIDMATDRLSAILARAVTLDNGRVCWRSSSGSYEGFAHGNSGIALALARAAERGIADAKALTIIEGAILWENDAVCRASGGWTEHEGTFCGMTDPAQWCHGASGIGLGRLRLLRSAALFPALIDMIEADVRRACSIVLSSAPLPSDYPCCGSTGRLSLLFEATRQGLCPDDVFVRSLQAWLDSVEEHGLRLLPATGAGLVPYGFFQGLAGVAYSLLRLRLPERLPQVLTVDPA